MNINIINNAEGLNGKMLKNGCLLKIHEESSEFEGINLVKMTFYDLKKNARVELRPDIKKCNIIKIDDIQYNSNYIYFAGMIPVKDKCDIVKITIYRYDYVGSKLTDIVYEFEENLENYNNYMRTRMFIVNENYMFIQNEYLRANFTEEYEGYLDFELSMYDIKNDTTYKIHDEQLAQCGIMSFIPISANTCILKTGFSLDEDNRYKVLKKEEAVLESISFVNIGQMVSDILSGKHEVVLDTIDSVYYNATIPYLKTDGKYICYSKVKFDDKFEEEIVFYDYKTKKSLMCINNNIDEHLKLARTCIMCDKPHIILKNTKGYEFVNVSNPDNNVILDMDGDVEYASEHIVVASGKYKGFLGKKRDVVCAFSFPSLKLLHREKGRFEGVVIADERINLLIK